MSSTSKLAATTLATVALAAATFAAPAAGVDRDAGIDAEPRALTFGGEVRLRYIDVHEARLVRGADTTQADFRGLVHADYRPTPRLHFRGEIGTGQLARDRSGASPSLQNRAAVQQLFVDVRNRADAGAGTPLLGATIGRQEFAEGPRQLLSSGDGSNLRRTWNGVRVYARGREDGITLFALRGTRLAPGAFDDGIRGDTTLSGATGTIALSRAEGGDASLQPFWYHTTLPLAGKRDVRDTAGLRLQGRRGGLRWDWTLAHQRGDAAGRDVRAWGLFAVQGLALSDTGWKPRLTSHVDIASGGASQGSGVLRDFHPLYASSSYLGEGQFLALSNLLLVAPGIAVSPTAQTTLSFEYGRAERLAGDGAVYASGMRAYAGTAGVHGRHIGNLARLGASWTPSPHLSLAFTAEHLAAGAILERAGFASGTYLQLAVHLRD
jgi:hypothetical protein